MLIFDNEKSLINILFSYCRLVSYHSLWSSFIQLHINNQNSELCVIFSITKGWKRGCLLSHFPPHFPVTSGCQIPSDTCSIDQYTKSFTPTRKYVSVDVQQGCTVTKTCLHSEPSNMGRVRLFDMLHIALPLCVAQPRVWVIISTEDQTRSDLCSLLLYSRIARRPRTSHHTGCLCTSLFVSWSQSESI